MPSRSVSSLPAPRAACALLMVVAMTSGCASIGGPPSEPAAPAVVETLPPSIASFDYDGYRHFDDGSGGYSLRYANPVKKRLADVYVYPVADENSGLDHEALVLGSTRATLQAIGEVVDQGLYANFAVLDAATRTSGVRTTARVQATYLRENLASYTLLYQTEHEGTLMKIRMSMPDNASNRANGEWDAFAARMFELLIDEVEAPSAAGDPDAGS